MIGVGSRVRYTGAAPEPLGVGVVEKTIEHDELGIRYLVDFRDAKILLKLRLEDLEEVIDKHKNIGSIQFDTAYMQASIQYFGECDLLDDVLTNHIQSIGAVVGLMRQILFGELPK